LAANILTPDGALAASLAAAPDMTLRMENLNFFIFYFKLNFFNIFKLF